MPIISATALKGGCGKTTLVHHAAGALALSGRRALAVDNDAQASLSSGMFWAAVEEMDPASTVAAVYSGMDPLPEQVIRTSGIPGVEVIAGSMAAARFNLPEPHASPVHAQACLRSSLAEGLSRVETVEAVREAAGRSRPSASKGGGAKARKVTGRVIRTRAGVRITLECRKGLDARSVEAALMEALATIRAELAEGQVAA